MSRKIKVGIIGAGTIGSVHADAYKKVADAELVALCDILPDKLAEKAKRHGVPVTYTDYKELLEPQPRGKGYLITSGGVPTPLTVPDVRDKERMKHRIYDALKSADERFPIRR